MSLSKNVYSISGEHREAGSWRTSLFAPLTRARALWAEKRTRARELGELHRFSDRELWDVGLSRSDIMSIEQGVYRRD